MNKDITRVFYVMMVNKCLRFFLSYSFIQKIIQIQRLSSIRNLIQILNKKYYFFNTPVSDQLECKEKKTISYL